MSFAVLNQTISAPLQFNWCGNGLTSGGTGSPYVLYDALSISNQVYVNINGVVPSIYTNPRGTLTYTFTKSGVTTGTTTGTALSTTYFQDSHNGTGTSNYNLKITDSNTGQSYTYLNGIAWGAV